VKRVFAALATVAIASVWLAGVAQAGTPPGSTVSQDNTACAGHGGFHALGDSGSAVHDIGVNHGGSNERPGATSWMFPNLNTGSTTGGNNNSLCGGGNVPPPFQ
jgi:hypothetical protein